MFEKVINSPIRWAGSKKKLLNEMLEKMFKRNKENYIEFFLGSGVVLLNVLKNKEILGYKNFFVNDINSNIIGFYSLLKNDVDFVIKELEKIEKEYNSKNMKEKEKIYYNIRSTFNSLNKDSKYKTIYFYFLMKTGFNGVYRENKKGEFNVPFGKKEKISIQKDNLIEISKLIQSVEFYNLDYNNFIEVIKSKCNCENSFIYCDPPYLPEDDVINKKQELYTKDSFNHEQFVDLMSKIKDSKYMISMTDSKTANSIYGKLKKYTARQLIRTINPQKSFKSTELIFSNYKLNNNKK